ncbi:MAG: serine/threonine protein kinase [Pseudonocardiales bacterium]|nr:serine/threonine protein kinase [Pseudonocardiales bacterium]
MSAEPRLVADRYRLDERIGSGAMGVVWRAHDQRLDRTVAVKQLLLQSGLSAQESEESRARAMREGRIAARLQHPHAISVFDVALGPDGNEGDPWLVMEYLPSRSLATVLAEQGPLPPREVARIGRQVADALAAAHGAGIVHRDVKPGNVLLGEDGTVKITDFGISRASWDVTVTRTGVLAGTPAYFAPEVARGETPSPAADVFSLGSTLYTAVEGAPPFGLDENTLALLRAVAEGRVRPPGQAGPLSALLMQLLRDQPTGRPTMTEARDALGAIAAGGGGSSATVVLPAAAAAEPPRPLRGATVAAPPPRTSGTGTPPRNATPPRTGTPPDSSPPLTPRDRPVAATPARPAAAPATPRWWQRRAVLTGAAAVLLVALGALALAITTGDPEQPSVAAPPSSSPPAPPTATIEPTIQPTTPEPTPPPSAPAEPGPVAFEQTVRDYYGLLPDRLDEAWNYLGPAVMEQAKGRSGYENFWGQFRDVAAENVAAEGNTVTLTIVYTRPNGSTFTEPYLLEMGTADDGRILITFSQKIRA